MLRVSGFTRFQTNSDCPVGTVSCRNLSLHIIIIIIIVVVVVIVINIIFVYVIKFIAHAKFISGTCDAVTLYCWDRRGRMSSVLQNSRLASTTKLAECWKRVLVYIPMLVFARASFFFVVLPLFLSPDLWFILFTMILYNVQQCILLLSTHCT